MLCFATGRHRARYLAQQPDHPLARCTVMQRGAGTVAADDISLGDGTDYANTERFQGSVPLLPDLCSLSVL